MRVSRQSLIFGLSYALDIAGKNNLSHSKSTAYLSVLIAKEIGMDEESALNLYYAALLHDIGIGNEYHLKEHCEIGAEMVSKLPLPHEIENYILYHHECFDGSGPFGLSGDNVPESAEIITLASAFDDLFGKEVEFARDLFLQINNWLDARRSQYSREIVSAFENLINREYFLLDYFNHETKYILSSKVVFKDNVYYGFEDIKKYAVCFADIIDQRSRFTFSHSTGIADLAQKITEYLGYDQETQNKMYIAGLLHDVGKLNVSTDILHKNGKLTPEERFVINKHTYFTRKVLEQIDGFEDIVDIAANHHEKLDGTGYPYHIKGERLSELEKIMSICDVYQALTEERPYRVSLSQAQVWEIIDKMAIGKHLDGELTAKVKQLFCN